MGAYDFYGSFCTCPPRKVYIGMRTRAAAETPSYPVVAYDVNVSSMGAAADKGAYLNLWNSDPDNRIIGTLYGAGGPFSFYILVNSGQTPPLYVIGDYTSTPANILPTANAGSDQTITLPTSTTTLVGSGVDPDGTIVSYLWTKLSGPTGGTITSASSSTTGITALQAGTYVFNLRVTDNDGGTGDDTISVVVSAPAFSFATQPVDQTVDAGDTVTITAVVQNGTANYTPRWYKNGALFLTQSAQSSATMSATFTPADGDTFYLTVTDSTSALITSNTVTITVTPIAIVVSYGFATADPYTDDSTIPVITSSTSTVSISHNSNLSLGFGSTAPDNYIIVKVPSGESTKTSFNNGSNLLVGDVIPSSEFRAPFTVGSFTYYVARNPLAFDYTQPLNFLS